MNVRLKVDISGTHDGEDWPPRGSVVELADHVAEDMIATGHAEAVEDELEIEVEVEAGTEEAPVEVEASTEEAPVEVGASTEEAPVESAAVEAPETATAPRKPRTRKGS